MGAYSHPMGSRQNQGQSKDEDILHLIAKAINSNLGSTEVQEWLIEEMSRIFQAEAGALFLLNDDQGELVLKRIGERRPSRVYQIDPRLGIGPLENCIDEKTPLSIHNPAAERGFNLFSYVLDFDVYSIICVPLVANKLSLGALTVINKISGSFDASDQEKLALVSTSLAHAIYNARLIQQLKVANADLEVSHWQLLHSRNTLRALFDSIPTSIYIVDRKYNLAAVNMHRANRTNEPPNLLVGRRCYEALYQRNDICSDCRVIDTLFGGQNTNRTKRQWENNDEPQEWEITTYPILDEKNQVIQAILLEQDVTEKRRMEATLAQSEKLAAVGQLAAGIAHEINNPLTAIIANAQLLQREIHDDDDKLELVDLISRAGQRASQVVRNLLDLARKEQYDFAPTDINETIQKSLAFLQHEFVARNVNLRIDFAENLPLIMASQNHLQGVWLNLLSNALDALENGHNEIRVSDRVNGNEIRIQISDTGKGIPPERLSRIFEPFYTTKAPGRGTGLGLSVCHRVIKQHGGRILVDSQPEIGTQFTVILPIS